LVRTSAGRIRARQAEVSRLEVPTCLLKKRNSVKRNAASTNASNTLDTYLFCIVFRDSGQGRCGEARKKGEKVILVAIPPSKPMSKIEQTMVLLVG
jgi:hypothetical protein